MKVMGTDGKEYTIKPEANLRDVNLSEADLGGTNLNSAGLSSANLNSADLGGADLSETVWDDETVFPEGFEIPEKSET